MASQTVVMASQTVVMRHVLFNNADNPQALVQQLTGMTVDSSVIGQSPAYVYDATGNLINNSTVYIFAVSLSNDASFRTTLLNGSTSFSTPVKTWIIPGVTLN
jgi:hypothetical protein